jgi:Flp pilus assembly pilin Flp
MDTKTKLRRLVVDEEGIVFAEHGLLFILIAFLVLLAVVALSSGSFTFFR